MNPQPGYQHRLDRNIRELQARDAKRFTVHLCPVCGFRRRQAQPNGLPETGCSTACNEILLKERKRKQRRMKALRFLAWERDLDAMAASA